jgi:hypothetical protein
MMMGEACTCAQRAPPALQLTLCATRPPVDGAESTAALERLDVNTLRGLNAHPMVRTLPAAS